MKSVSIRELHEKTGAWVRRVTQLGEVRVTDRGRPVARLVAEPEVADVPYFARRKLDPAFRRLMASGRLRKGSDVTELISEDRDA